MAKQRRVRTWVKVVLVLIPVIAGIICLIIFGFKLKTIEYSSDLHEYTTEEVKAYLDTNKIDNAFTLWFRDLIGHEKNINLFEDYDVRLKSFSKVEIKAREKQFKGYIKNDKMFDCFDEDGRLLKISDVKWKGKPKVKGLTITNATLYKKIKVSDPKQLKAVLQVANMLEKYDFEVKKITVNKNCEVTVSIKKFNVDFGKTTNLKEKVVKLNDMYNNLKKLKGTVDMKNVNNEGKYILKRTKNH